VANKKTMYFFLKQANRHNGYTHANDIMDQWEKSHVLQEKKEKTKNKKFFP